MNKCPNKSKVVQLSLDGVQESRSSTVSMDVYSIKQVNCKCVFPIRLIRTFNRYKMDERNQFKKVLDDLNNNSFHVKDVVGDNPKRSFMRCAKCFSATYGCEYCESCAVQIKDAKGISEVKKKYKMLRDNLAAKIELLKNGPNTSTSDNNSQIASLNSILVDLDKEEKKEISTKASTNLCWPQSTMNGELRTEEKVLEIVNNIEQSSSQLLPSETKGFIGRSLLLSQPNFNFIDNIVTEYMHSVCLGTVKRLTELTFNVGEKRNRITTRKLSDAKDFNRQIRIVLTPGELSRRCRNLDFAVLKASEFRNIIIFFFPIVLNCIEDPYEKEKNVWLDLAYAVRACLVTNEEFAKVDVRNITQSIAHFYKGYESIFGGRNCTYSIHIVGSHILQMRGDEPLSSRSAFPFESFYSEMKNAFVPGTVAPLKQILKNTYMKRQLEKHTCVRKITYSCKPKKLQGKTITVCTP